MDEATAKTKWCPFVRLVGGVDVNFTPSFNRMVAQEKPEEPRFSDAARCIASDCMAWRWNQTPSSNAERQQQGSDPLGQLRGPHGYCGLARRD